MKSRYTNPTTLLLALACTVSLLGGCAKSTEKTSAGTDTKTETTAETKTTEGAQSEGGAKTDADKGAETKTAANDPSQLKINIDELPNDLTICTVAGQAIKVGDYRRMMKLQAMQMQAQINGNGAARAQLLEQAKKGGVTLTADEEQKLFEAAKAEHQRAGKSLDQFLKDKKMTEAQYRQEVTDLGLIYKASTMILQQQLLPELVNRELLSRASIKAGKEKQAMDKYLVIKRSKEWKQLKEATGLPADALKDELVKAELAQMQIEKIMKNIKVSDAEVKQVYNANKSKLQHKERIRLASILIAAPDEDMPGVESVRTQVKKANSKLTGKELDATVAQVIQNQQNRALIVLGRAKAKEDFGKLANENTDDLQSKQKKNGGDLGWQEKGQLVPEFADAVWSLKPGEVLPKLVKTNLGYQIIKVTGHEPAGALSMNEVRPLLEAKIRQAKMKQAVAQWIDDQRKYVKIEFSPSFIAVANNAGNKTQNTTATR